MTPWTVAHQAPLSMGFSRQEYWSGLPLPSPGDLPSPGIEPGLPHCRQTLYYLSHQGSSKWNRSVMSNSLCPMNCRPPGSSVHGIFQARVLEWVTISFSRGSSLPRDRTQVSHIVSRHLTVWATKQVKWSGIPISWKIFQFVVIHTVKGFSIVNKA